MIKAVLFDNDGVIAETELNRFRGLKKFAEKKRQAYLHGHI